MSSIARRALAKVFHISRYYAWWVLVFSLVLTGIAAYYVIDLPVRSSFLDLLPSNDPLIDEYRENEQYLTRSDSVTLLVTLNDDDSLYDSEFLSALAQKEALEGKSRLSKEEEETLATLTQHVNGVRSEHLLIAAEQIYEELKANPEFVEVTYLIEPSPRIPDQYLLLFQLDEEKLAMIESKVALAQSAIAEGEGTRIPPSGSLSDLYREVGKEFEKAITGPALDAGEPENTSAMESQLEEFINLNDAVLSALEGIEAFPSVTAAVNGLTEIFTPQTEQVSRKPEAIFSRDRRSLLMTVQPRFPAHRGVTYCEQVTNSLRESLDSVGLDRLGVTVGVTGTYEYAVSTNSIINGDMVRTTIISSIGVVVIFFFAFGSVFYSIVAVAPLLVSVVLTMAWAKLSVGGFNLLTTFLPALVLGIGIDYAIHLVSRYAEERGKGASLNRALYTAVISKGEASIVAVITTSLVFVGLLFSRSRALFEMGAITSVGVIFSFLFTFFLVPALIAISHFVYRKPRKETTFNYTPHLARYFHFVTGRSRVIFVTVITLTFFVAFQAAHTQFLFSSDDLVPRVESQEVLEEILDRFYTGSTDIGNYFTFFAASEEQLSHVVDELEHNELIEGVDSARSLLPVNLSEQQQVLNELDIGSYLAQLDVLSLTLEERSSLLPPIRTLLSQFALLQYGAGLSGLVDIALDSNLIQLQLRETQNAVENLDVDTAEISIADLREALAALERNLVQIRDLPPLEKLLADILKGLPDEISGNYVTADGKYIIRARLTPGLAQGGNLKTLNDFAASISDNYFGMPLVTQKLENYMKRDFLVSTLIAASLIIIALWTSLRRVTRAVLAAASLVLGYIWMLGGMRLLNIEFNFVNIAISPLLIGIGVDSGIHILHRYMEERKTDPQGSIERGSSATAIAVIVTSLTTMLVFGSLLFARTPGLRFLGASALLGIGFTLVFSLLFLPAALLVERGKRV